MPDTDLAIRCAALAHFEIQNGTDGDARLLLFTEMAIDMASDHPDAIDGEELRRAAEAEILRLSLAYEDTIADPQFDPQVAEKDRLFCDGFAKQTAAN